MPPFKLKKKYREISLNRILKEVKDFYQSTKPTRTIRIVGLIDITALIRVETHSKNRVAIC